MLEKKVLIVKNVHREGPGLIRTLLEENGIGFGVVGTGNINRLPNPQEYSAVILLGGPQSANDEEMKSELEFIARTIDYDVPYLGICLGAQALVKAAGGKVERAPFKEVGCKDVKENYFQVELTEDGKNDGLLRCVNETFPIFQLHGETVTLRNGMVLLGTGKGPYQIRNQIVKVAPKTYGIQGHLEVTKPMLGRWIEQDTMFHGYDTIAISRDFRGLQHEYHQNGRTMISNFLRISGLIS